MNFEEFLHNKNQFTLGNLTTESFHPKTLNLSIQSKENLPLAIETLKEVDIDAFNLLLKLENQIYETFKKLKDSLQKDSKIFICGCGATGRLALAIETIARFNGINNIVGFMAGGDFALIKSVESFEDRMEYGRRQLRDLAFKEGDVLIAVTEGGETSFVIGAALEATELGSLDSYFLYCNPDSELENLDRFKMILKNSKVHRLNLTIGPMALSGSTRMQATTVQMFVTGLLALKHFSCETDFSKYFQDSINELKCLEYKDLEQFIIGESNEYINGKKITYQSCEKYAISVLTDTTERSPTFNLPPFETSDDSYLALSYLSVEGANESYEGWRKMLKRDLRELKWGDEFTHIGIDRILKFDISQKSIDRRAMSSIFSITELDGDIVFKLDELQSTIKLSDDLLVNHLKLKLLLNTLSTLIMGRLNRYESNVMTWVKPANYKLIDRATRYSLRLLEIDDVIVEYNDVAKFIFDKAKMPNSSNESIVRAAVNYFKK
jgi:N-acetylmuramic acid 6-phosphate etherase